MQPIPGFDPSQPANPDDLALLDEWYDDWISADRSVESAQTYLRFLTHLAKVLAAEDKTLADATQADLKKFLRHLGEDRKAATRAYHTRVIRSFYNWLADEYDIDSPAQKIKLPKQPLTEVRSISDEDLDKLRAVLSPRKPTWTDRRDLAIIETLAASGMRIGECVAVQMEHLDLEGSAVGCHVVGDSRPTGPRNMCPAHAGRPEPCRRLD